MPKAPGPVRALLFLDTYRLLILGEVFDVSDQERAYGYDYINIVDTRDGYTDRQFEAIKPNDIVQIVKLGPGSVIVSAEPAGVVGWNTVDVNALDWVSKGIAPLYMAAGPEGTALLVGEDGLSLTLLDTKDGTRIMSGRLAQIAVGDPIFFEGMFIVPTQGGIEILGPDIVKVGSVVIEGYGDKAGILGVTDGFYFVGEDLVAKFGF